MAARSALRCVPSPEGRVEEVRSCLPRLGCWAVSAAGGARLRQGSLWRSHGDAAWRLRSAAWRSRAWPRAAGDAHPVRGGVGYGLLWISWCLPCGSVWAPVRDGSYASERCRLRSLVAHRGLGACLPCRAGTGRYLHAHPNVGVRTPELRLRCLTPHGAGAAAPTRLTCAPRLPAPTLYSGLI